jgi:ankyrin repeat protein
MKTNLGVSVFLGVCLLVLAPGSNADFFDDFDKVAVTQGNDKNKALWDAAVFNDVAKAKALLKEGADPNATFPDVHNKIATLRDCKVTSLANAAYRPDFAMFELLIRNGANVDNIRQRDEYGLCKYTSALIRAVQHNASGEVVKMLLDTGTDINATTINDYTALYLAVRNKSSTEVVGMLLDAGAEVNVSDDSGYTPLFISIDVNASSEVIEMLVNAGADIDKPERFGWTPLLHAMRRNVSVEVVKILLDAGAEVDHSPLSDGWSPLMVAAGNNASREVVEILLDAGADVNITGKNGWTPLMVAAANNASSEVVKVLLDAGAEVNISRSDGLTPLMYAVRYSTSSKVVEILLDAGAEVNVANKYGLTPLHLVALREDGNVSFARELVAYGADPEAQGGERGLTATQLALERNLTGFKSEVEIEGLRLKLARDKKLPPKIRRDMYMVALADMLKRQNYEKALVYFDVLDAMGVKTEPSFTHFWGEALVRTGNKELGKEKLYQYVKDVGSSGKYYKRALGLLNEIN